jgi:[ribosomal protein S5]-alanine N-acetyltransferase
MLPKLQTERLCLRPLAPNDADSISLALGAWEIANTTLSIPHPYPDGEATRYIDRKIAECEREKSLVLAIERRCNQTFLGVVELHQIDREHAQAELSFWLTVAGWGQGYMSEAIQPLLKLGFTHLDLNRIYGYHMVRNPASGRVMQKNGLVLEGILRQRVRKWGKFEDVALRSILRSDWQQQNLNLIGA